MTDKSRVAIASIATIASIASIATVTLFAISTALTLSSYGSTSLVFAQGPPTIVLSLTGNDEVPPVQTNATGVAGLNQVGREYRTYSVNATDIQGATAGHIHLGAKGENGPVVLTLFKFDKPMNQVSENGTITADKFEGPMAGKQMSDLATAGVQGKLYVNIHTEKNPNGEIRGQVGSPIIP
jgi:hypothetical protein